MGRTTLLLPSLLRGKPEMVGMEEHPDSAGHTQPQLCLLVLDRLRLLSCWAWDATGVTAVVGVQRLQVKREEPSKLWYVPG